MLVVGVFCACVCVCVQVCFSVLVQYVPAWICCPSVLTLGKCFSLSTQWNPSWETTLKLSLSGFSRWVVVGEDFNCMETRRVVGYSVAWKQEGSLVLQLHGNKKSSWLFNCMETRRVVGYSVAWKQEG